MEVQQLELLNEKYIPNYPTHMILRIVLGYQHKDFTSSEKEKFFSSSYTITSDISRMGYKLQGQTIGTTQKGIISEGISFGAVQIPPDGQPIILLKERQTIGGYPKMGSVLPSDCFRLAHLVIGSTVKFEGVSVEDAQEEMKVFYGFFD